MAGHERANPIEGRRSRIATAWDVRQSRVKEALTEAPRPVPTWRLALQPLMKLSAIYRSSKVVRETLVIPGRGAQLLWRVIGAYGREL
jgi:hypothetical protein